MAGCTNTVNGVEVQWEGPNSRIVNACAEVSIRAGEAIPSTITVGEISLLELDRQTPTVGEWDVSGVTTITSEGSQTIAGEWKCHATVDCVGGKLSAEIRVYRYASQVVEKPLNTLAGQI
ncbi:hypothetical protein [Subtercola boreus]|uniref:Uncharacterized protein n=1 Tax=Subtercola boreus TaxID=120213 RepID=A0A3E0WB22_9MICO|nr:hypothetical protein [Subtercola boreus]RFA27629.1 hypothetical protein B7R25_07870 [Subtercola boreus]